MAGFLLCLWTSVPEIFADTHTAVSCSYSDVNSAVSAASAGDTIIVPAGTCTWASQLNVTKGITIQGTGTGVTNIYGTGGSYWFINASPPINTNFRVTGFSFNIGGQNAVKVSCSAPANGRVRIDHNSFTNSTGSQTAIQNWGCFGVIDSNTFDSIRYPLGIGWGNGSGLSDYQNYSDLVWGGSDNMYLEDNTFTNISLGVITDSDRGGGMSPGTTLSIQVLVLSHYLIIMEADLGGVNQILFMVLLGGKFMGIL